MLGLGGWGGVDQKQVHVQGEGEGWESKITKSEHTYIMDDPIWKMADS